MRDDDLAGRVGELLRYGRVESVDLASGRMTVAIGDITTQPVRWFTGGSGGTKVWSRAKVGEQVVLICPEGDIAGAIALRGVDCTAFPAVGDTDRELVRFEDGAALSYDPAAHDLEVVLPAGATVKIVAPGGVRVESDVRITGDLTVDGDVKAGTVSLRQHVHQDVATGTALSGVPRP